MLGRDRQDMAPPPQQPQMAPRLALLDINDFPQQTAQPETASSIPQQLALSEPTPARAEIDRRAPQAPQQEAPDLVAPSCVPEQSTLPATAETGRPTPQAPAPDLVTQLLEPSVLECVPAAAEADRLAAAEADELSLAAVLENSQAPEDTDPQSSSVLGCVPAAAEADGPALQQEAPQQEAQEAPQQEEAPQEEEQEKGKRKHKGKGKGRGKCKATA